MEADGFLCLREHRVLCPSLSQQCIDPTLGKINIGKGRRKICSDAFVTWGAFKHIHPAVAFRLCSPVTATYSDQTSCRGQSRVWGIGAMEVQGQRHLRGPSTQLPQRGWGVWSQEANDVLRVTQLGGKKTGIWTQVLGCHPRALTSGSHRACMSGQEASFSSLQKRVRLPRLLCLALLCQKPVPVRRECKQWLRTEAWDQMGLRL